MDYLTEMVWKFNFIEEFEDIAQKNNNKREKEVLFLRRASIVRM